METGQQFVCDSLRWLSQAVAEIEKFLSLRLSATQCESVRLSATHCDSLQLDLPRFAINLTPNTRKMALFNEKSMVFLDVVHNFDCVYNRFSKDFKNEFKKYNCWITIGEKFGLSPEEAEKNFETSEQRMAVFVSGFYLIGYQIIVVF